MSAKSRLIKHAAMALVIGSLAVGPGFEGLAQTLSGKLAWKQDQGTALKAWEIEPNRDDSEFIQDKGIKIVTYATATDGEIIVQADRVELVEKTDVVTATGNVRYFSAETNMACDKAVIYRKEKKAVLTEAVDMFIKAKDKRTKAVIEEIPSFKAVPRKEPPKEGPPKQDGKKDDELQNPKTARDHPTSITAAKVEYWYGKGNRHAVITGNPFAQQSLAGGRWRQTWAHNALYDGEKETLTLQSGSEEAKDVHYQSSTGDDLIARTVYTSTAEEDDYLRAVDYKGKVYGKADEDESPAPASGQEEDSPLKAWEFEPHSKDSEYLQKNGVKTMTFATVRDGEIIAQMDKAELVEETDIVTATGNVRYFSAKANMACDKAVIYRKEKKAVLTETVDMFIKAKDKQTKATIEEIPSFKSMPRKEPPKEGETIPPPKQGGGNEKVDEELQNPKTVRDYPTSITAAKVEHWYGKGNRHAVITGEPFAQQVLPLGRWRQAWSHNALYDGEKETLTLKSSKESADVMEVHYEATTGDNLVANSVLISTVEGKDYVEAQHYQGKFYQKSKDSDVGIKPPDPIKPRTGGGRGGGSSTNS